MSIAWLHLTDLHMGMAGMRPTWNAGVKAAFYRDLEEVKKRVGAPIRLVLFTGDLVQSGDGDQYRELSKWLAELRMKLESGGTKPMIFAVPGNHDLKWPNADDARVRALLRWKTDRELAADVFWHETRGKTYRDVIHEAFADYTEWASAWSKEHQLPEGVTFNPGVLPGEWAARLEAGELRLGLVGLNSAFLHLNGQIRRGDLALHPNQLLALCGDDLDGWLGDNHVNLLLTHHPPDWLSSEALASYTGEMMVPTRFHAHLCGHMHEATASVTSIGGAAPQRLSLGASLFGRERYRDESGNERESRVHGYNVGRAQQMNGRMTVRIWPRQLKGGGLLPWRMVPDHDRFALDDQDAITLTDVAMNAPAVVSSQRRPLSDRPPAPGGGYHPKLFVGRRALEKVALAALEDQGTPVTIAGPPKFGKTAFLQRLITRIDENDKKTAVVFVDLGSISREARRAEDPAASLRELAERVVESYSLVVEQKLQSPSSADTWIEPAWNRPGTPDRKLTRIMRDNVLSTRFDRVVLVLDAFEKVIGRPTGDAIARILRLWAGDRIDPQWRRLRLLIAASGASLYFRNVDEVSEFFNACFHVKLEPFSLADLDELARAYKLDWSETQLKELFALLDGHPYYSSLVFFHEANGVGRGELLDKKRLKDSYFSPHLNQAWLQLQAREDLYKALCALATDPMVKLDAHQYELLYREGLVRREHDNYRITNQVFAEYLRERC